jgi:plasmid stabilization system protein ParE
MTLHTRPGFYQDVAREQLRLLDRAGAEIAEAWRVAVLQTIDFLQSNPFAGRERKDLREPGIRSWRVKRFRRWLILYGARDEVLILHRVIYGTMDLPKLEFN